MEGGRDSFWNNPNGIIKGRDEVIISHVGVIISKHTKRDEIIIKDGRSSKSNKRRGEI